VIAKLGAQRAAAAAPSTPAAAGGGRQGQRVRSSMATGERRSFGGIKSSARGSVGTPGRDSSAAALAAKVRARRSEAARRRSTRTTGSEMTNNDIMNVD
jgi:hypothetical protein